MYVLAIHHKHDASACLLKDNKIIAFVEEERFKRKKHYAGFPEESVKYCLNTAGITLDDVDYFAVGLNPPTKSLPADIYNFYIRGIAWKFSSIKTHLSHAKTCVEETIRMNGLAPFVKKGVPKDKLFYCEHHLSHAASAFRASKFDKSAIITVDGWGDFTTATLGTGEDNNIKIWKRFKAVNSLGLLYSSFTAYLGYDYGGGHESKVMGMAAYGKPTKDFSEIITSKKGEFKVNTDYCYDDRRSLKNIEKKFGPRLDNPFKEINSHYADIAATLQKELENAVLNLLEEAVEVSGSKNLSIAGGTALNCKMNGMLLKSGMIDDIFVQPAAGDHGKPLGAALECLAAHGKKGRVEFEHAYWGPEFSNDYIKKVLDYRKIKYEECSDISGEVAELIAKGNVIGWFQGRMEVGPRALGNRSILADPTKKEMLKKLNIIKGREGWRPLAASFLRKSMEEYFGVDKDSPFMIVAFFVLPEKCKEIPAVVHADGSSRPQSVEKRINEKYWKLIKEFESITGVPAVLNTSFNYREPIVCKPEEAIATFYATPLDYLAIGNFLIKK